MKTEVIEVQRPVPNRPFPFVSQTVRMVPESDFLELQKRIIDLVKYLDDQSAECDEKTVRLRKPRFKVSRAYWQGYARGYEWSSARVKELLK